VKLVTIYQSAQSLTPGEAVSLFRIDVSSVGGGLLYFVQGSEFSEKIKFGGIEYQPMDVEFDGLEVTGQGALPSPSIRLSNTDGIAQAMINTFGDLLGCEVRRIRTFRRHLDGQPDADPSAFFGPDVFLVERKVSENPVYIEWELSASIDQEGRMIPGRVAIRDTCLWRYRVWSSGQGAFDYSKAQCPYTGNRYYDINNLPTTASKDRPSRTLACCKLRFGENAALPFGGFPGVGRVSA
jgi:lambda family phage minor tail protein L